MQSSGTSLGYRKLRGKNKEEEEGKEQTENDNLEKWLSMTLSVKPQPLNGSVVCEVHPLLPCLAPSQSIQ